VPSTTEAVLPASESDNNVNASDPEESVHQHNHPERASEAPDEVIVMPVADQYQTVSNPGLKCLAHIFPPYLCKRIRLSATNASVDMYYYWGLYCTLELLVLPTSIPYLAMELFGTHLELNEGTWDIVQSNGGSQCFECTTLRGARGEGITRVFGPHVARAVEETHARKQEAALSTDCVKFQIKGNATEDGKFVLDLEWEASFFIKSMLFPGM
jgi:hypothetical protein